MSFCTLEEEKTCAPTTGMGSLGCHISMCFQGPSGCLGNSHIDEGAVDLTSHMDELNDKLSNLAKKRSNEVDTFLRENNALDEGVSKILLLGGPSSGKSTVFKQMQIIHNDGFKKPQQLEYFKDIINYNIYEIFQQLIVGATNLEIDLSVHEKLIEAIDNGFKSCRYISTLTFRIDPILGGFLTQFWQTKEIRSLYDQRYRIELHDSAKYYLENLDRISNENYNPNEEDIVHTRLATYTITHTTFEYNGLKLKLVDVGGQKSQRRKWIHLFDDARVILFVVDLTGYAKKTDAVKENHDLHLARRIFREVTTNKMLKKAVILLFLNKVDLFTELLQAVPFSSVVKEFSGKNTVQETTQYIQEKFVHAARPRKSVFPHTTTAINTENIKHVFRACMESVFKANSRATGLA